MVGFRGYGLRSLVISLRPHNGLACAALAWAGLRRGGLPSMDLQVLGISAAVFLLVSGAHVLNDLLDRTADRINRPTRPLVKGDLRVRPARRAAVLLTSAGLLLGIWAQPTWWFWWLIWVCAGFGYSLVAKGNGWWGPFCTAAVIASLYLPGACRDGCQPTDLAVLVLALYFLLFREFIKTLEDARGDGAAGYRSLAGGRWDTRLRPVLLALPLFLAIVAVGWLEAVDNWGRVAAAVFSGSLLAAVIVLPRSRQRRHHLAGTVLKIGALGGLAQLWALPLDVFS